MIAEGVRDTELADYQRACRTLLVHPLVTGVFPDRTALGLISRFAAPLAADLDEVAGYRLEVASSCARLLRRVDRLDGTQHLLRRRDRKPFDRRRYAYLCLVLAALGQAGSQVALTELVDALTRRAAEIHGLGFDPDQYRHRLAFADVVRHLIELGGLREVEVSTIDWVRDPGSGEALYDLDRDVLHLVVVAPRVLQHVSSVRSLMADGRSGGDGPVDPVTMSRGARRAATHRRVVRLLLEHPVVYLQDLDDGARSYLISQGRAIGDDLQRLTGAQLERRSEGAALIDATGGFSDRRFPAGGTATQVALLLADAMASEVERDTDGLRATATVPLADQQTGEAAHRLDAARPYPPTSGDLAVLDAVPFPGDPVADTDRHRTDAGDDLSATGDDSRGTGNDLPGTGIDDRPPKPGAAPLFSDAWLSEQVRGLCATHGRTFAAGLRDDPAALVRAALQVLTGFDLVRPVPGGVVALPAVARYRDLVVTHAPPPQLSLLEPPTPSRGHR